MRILTLPFLFHFHQLPSPFTFSVLCAQSLFLSIFICFPLHFHFQSLSAEFQSQSLPFVFFNSPSTPNLTSTLNTWATQIKLSKWTSCYWRRGGFGPKDVVELLTVWPWRHSGFVFVASVLKVVGPKGR